LGTIEAYKQKTHQIYLSRQYHCKMYLARKELADVLFSISLKNGELQRYEPALRRGGEDSQRIAGYGAQFMTFIWRMPCR
jgi:hypothetical protein